MLSDKLETLKAAQLALDAVNASHELAIENSNIVAVPRGQIQAPDSAEPTRLASLEGVAFCSYCKFFVKYLIGDMDAQLEGAQRISAHVQACEANPLVQKLRQAEETRNAAQAEATKQTLLRRQIESEAQNAYLAVADRCDAMQRRAEAAESDMAIAEQREQELRRALEAIRDASDPQQPAHKVFATLSSINATANTALKP
jgi:hypothetical protein